MMRTPMRVAMLVCALFVSAGPLLSAQVRMRNSQAQLLRDAASRESRGDFDGAEEVLRRLLESDPGSSGGLFALERVLRAKGTIVTILSVVDAYLDQDSESSGVRALKLRALVEADSLDEVRQEAEAWIASDVGHEVAYREISRVYERAFGTDAALTLLRDGRDGLGNAHALALEMGDLFVVKGDFAAAADEWALAVGDDGSQVATVTRRIQGLTREVEQTGTRVVEQLVESTGIPRRRAAVRIALDLGLGDLAMPAVLAVESELEGRVRATFLADVARRARDNDLVDAASWAYDELGEDAATPVERRQFDQSLVDVSLSSGDTVAALEAQRRLARSFTPGSVDRRRATAQVIRLEGTRSDLGRLRGLLLDFREEFPNAPELDDIAATVALALQSRGDREGATAVLDGIDGPKSSLERGFLLLAVGEMGEGRSALLRALTGLPPAEATAVIQFTGLLARVSEQGAPALAAAGVEAHRGRPAEAAADLAEATQRLKGEERPPLLAQAARMASDGDDPELAAAIRRQILDEYPDAPEVGDASLALAQYYVERSNVVEAVRLLEKLITSRPNAAVVPGARLELERLRGLGW
jgi:tetratricopeptide (TPR) repeat protein